MKIRADQGKGVKPFSYPFLGIGTGLAIFLVSEITFSLPVLPVWKTTLFTLREGRSEHDLTPMQ